MSERWLMHDARTRAVGGPDEPVRRVTVTVLSGAVDVLGHDEQDARVEVVAVRGPELSVSYDDGHLQIAHHPSAGALGEALLRLLAAGPPSARLVLAVPRRAEVRIRTAGASVLVTGLDGETSVTTVTGSVGAESTSGTLSVRSGTGEVAARDLHGRLHVNTGSAPVTLVASAPRQVQVSTLSGAVDLDLTDANCLVNARSASGSLRVRLPEGSGYDVTAHSLHGQVLVAGESVRDAGESVRDAVASEAAHPAAATDDAPTPHGEGAGGHRAAGDRALVVKARSRSGDIIVALGRG